MKVSGFFDGKNYLTRGGNMTTERNPSIQEIKSLILSKIISTCIEWPDRNPDNGYRCRLQIPIKDIEQVVKRATCFVLSDLGLWGDFKVEIRRGKRRGVFIVDGKSSTAFCKVELDGIYDNEYVRQPSILLMSTTGLVRELTIWDLATNRLHQAKERKAKCIK